MESDNGEAYDFKTNKILCTFNCVKEAESIVLKGVVVVEDFTSATSISRNMIKTFKREKTKEAERYKQILDTWKQKDVSQYHQEHELFFLVAHLSCESISKVLMNRFRKAVMPKAEIHLCKSNPERRQKWFANFAYFYGVVGGDISPQACFIDLQPLAGRIDWSHKWRTQLCVQAKELKIKLAGNQVAPEPLSAEEREIYRKNIVDALQKKPSDRYNCPRICSTWLPRWLVCRMKAVLPADCWKKSFISVHYPDFHLAIAGANGVGKSTFMQWLMFYGGIKRPALRNYDAFGVCPPNDGSCTLKYSRERFSSSHFFYDTKGLLVVHKDYAKSVADLLRGKSTSLGSKTTYEKDDGNKSTGTFFPFVWSLLVAIWHILEVMLGILILRVATLHFGVDIKTGDVLFQFYGWLIALVTILIVMSYRFISIYLWIFLVIAEIAILLRTLYLTQTDRATQTDRVYLIKIVFFVLSFWIAFFVLIFIRQTDVNYNEGDADAKIHAFALLTKFPQADTDFETLNNFIVELKDQLDGNTGVENFAVAITSNDHCKMASVEECQIDFETRLGGHLGTTKLLDILEKPNTLKGGYSKIKNATGVFLEPDRIYFLLEDLQNRAFAYYENVAEVHYKQASSQWVVGACIYCFAILLSYAFVFYFFELRRI